MGCWKWFNNILKEAKVEIIDKNKERIDKVSTDTSGKRPITAAVPLIGGKLGR